jgi:hypothetical protein
MAAASADKSISPPWPFAPAVEEPIAMSRSSRFHTVPVLLAGLMLVACTETRYTGYDPDQRVDPLLARQIAYEVDPDLYRHAPDCVAVLATRAESTPDAPPTALAEEVERALGRHLTTKVGRVIGPFDRRRIERSRALDLDHAQDRDRFARMESCPLFLRAVLISADDDYFLIWSQRRLGLELVLYENEEVPLWQATHTARRSDGNLPLSLLSIPLAAIEAASFRGDDDQLPSMIDDAVRRMFVTLPDFR